MDNVNLGHKSWRWNQEYCWGFNFKQWTPKPGIHP